MFHVWVEGEFIHGFGGETEEERSLGRSRCKWEDNITMGFELVDWKGVGWNHWLTTETSVRGCCGNCNEHFFFFFILGLGD